MPTRPSGPNRAARRHPDQHPDLPPAVLDRFATAGYIGVGLTMLAELTSTGEIPSLTVGRRRLYRVVDLDSWVASQVAGSAA